MRDYTLHICPVCGDGMEYGSEFGWECGGVHLAYPDFGPVEVVVQFDPTAVIAENRERVEAGRVERAERIAARNAERDRWESLTPEQQEVERAAMSPMQRFNFDLNRNMEQQLRLMANRQTFA